MTLWYPLILRCPCRRGSSARQSVISLVVTLYDTHRLSCRPVKTCVQCLTSLTPLAQPPQELMYAGQRMTDNDAPLASYHVPPVSITYLGWSGSHLPLRLQPSVRPLPLSLLTSAARLAGQSSSPPPPQPSIRCLPSLPLSLLTSAARPVRQSSSPPPPQPSVRRLPLPLLTSAARLVRSGPPFLLHLSNQSGVCQVCPFSCEHQLLGRSGNHPHCSLQPSVGCLHTS